MAASSRRIVADRVVTAVLVAAVVSWSGLYAVVGPLLLRPVSTCGGPEYRCTGFVDLGVSVASWAPAVVAVVMLAAVARSAARGRAMTPAAGIAVVLVAGLQTLGQAFVALGVLPS